MIFVCVHVVLGVAYEHTKRTMIRGVVCYVELVEKSASARRCIYGEQGVISAHNVKKSGHVKKFLWHWF